MVDCPREETPAPPSTKDAPTSSTRAMQDGATRMEADAAHRKYERKTKRFAWPDELHRLFVAAIFDLGLKNASPKALLPFMQPTATNSGLTTEHLKSHLQKYRINYDKSRAEFLAFFDDSAKRNGKRRRRSTKSTDSHTKFIFPINPRASGMDPPTHAAGVPAGDSFVASDVSIDRVAPPQQIKMDHTIAYAPHVNPQLTPRTSSRIDRANLIRLAQQNAAAAALASHVPPLSFSTGLSPRDPPQIHGGYGGSMDLTDPQWGILASLLSPQSSSSAPAALITGGAKEPFLLNEDTTPHLQLQMHLAMQAQMNLHRQMLNRKVAVSQHYYNQAAAVKRAAASAMVERVLQDAANAQQLGQQQHQQQQQQQQHQQHLHSQPTAATSSRPSISMNQSVQSGISMPPPWDQVDIEMSIGSDDQNDLFSFLKSSE